ncbi:MAG: hypothetical protein QNK04_20600 [Myxococcota bacterium]|nr:hypothetical protein [Myxococcota bacterium]
MLRSDPEHAGRSREPGEVVLYLEGPRDRGILMAWCRRLMPSFARSLSRSSVILGGRQPARALEHFRGLGGAEAGARGLCVLDRDDGRAPALDGTEEPGLEFFTWGRRHIESYLLVPGAIARALSVPDSEGRVERALRGHLPTVEEDYRDLDAKRILAPTGPVSRALGVPIPLARVARATRPSELHADVHAFFGTLRSALGLVDAEVVR